MRATDSQASMAGRCSARRQLGPGWGGGEALRVGEEGGGGLTLAGKDAGTEEGDSDHCRGDGISIRGGCFGGWRGSWELWGVMSRAVVRRSFTPLCTAEIRRKLRCFLLRCPSHCPLSPKRTHLTLCTIRAREHPAKHANSVKRSEKFSDSLFSQASSARDSPVQCGWKSDGGRFELGEPTNSPGCTLAQRHWGTRLSLAGTRQVLLDAGAGAA